MGLPRRNSSDPQFTSPLPRRFDTVVAFGDFNFRVDESEVEIKNSILIKKYSVKRVVIL